MIYNYKVMAVIDIGHSAYSQLQKHKGQEIDYDDGTDEEENEAKEFFKKSSEGAKVVGNAKNKVFFIYATKIQQKKERV